MKNTCYKDFMSKQTTLQIGVLVVLGLVGAGLLWKLPPRVEPFEPVEDSDELNSVLGDLLDQDSPPASSAAELRERYVEEGYPSADQISTELADEIWNAFVDKKLYTIDEVSDGYYPQTIYLVSVADPTEVNYDYCGFYSPGLCLAIYEHGDEHRILHVFAGMRGAPTEEAIVGNVKFDQFLPDADLVLLTTSFGDGPGGETIYWAMNIKSGEMQKVVTMSFSYGGDGGVTKYTLTHATSGDAMEVVLRSIEEINEQTGTSEIIYNHLTMNDAEGVLIDQPIDIPSSAYPVLTVDTQSSLNGTINFTFRFEEDTQNNGKQIYEWANYTYDSSSTQRLVEQQIP